MVAMAVGANHSSFFAQVGRLECKKSLTTMTPALVQEVTV
jgi:hypothetical protein